MDTRVRLVTGAEPTHRFATQTAAILFACWSMIAGVGLLLPSPGQQSTLSIALVTLTALCAAALAALARRDVPAWVPGAAPVVGIAIASAQVCLMHDAAGDALEGVAMAYVWLALYSAYFLSREQATVQIGLTAAAYGGVLVASVPTDQWAMPWTQVVGTAVVGTVLLRRVRQAVAELVWRLSDAASSDPLTGLVNRRGFEERIDLEVTRARRHGRPLSVMIADADHFKRVNDTLGHRAGDDALVKLAGIFLAHERSIDLIARSGGEEFTILLPDTDSQQAHRIAERLRRSIERDFAGDEVPLTLSFGIAGYPDHGDSSDSLLESADQALYAAKALGRNRVVIFTEEIAAAFAPERARGLEGEVELATLLSLAEALDLRDTGTALHSRTVGRYCAMIAQELGLTAERVKRIEIAGMLHDVGKMGIPDAILRKPDQLSQGERTEIATHPEIGAQILSADTFEDIREWVLAHHERPDGKGYPNGLTDAEIPLESKILAVADAYEAMTADRPYRSALDHGTSRTELLRCAGSQFDGRVVSALLARLSRDASANGDAPDTGGSKAAEPVDPAPQRLTTAR